ncbi:MAG: hypothetical protein FJ280_29825 [Planctomycetes bacterium]|nr:hypothetical protein [Planctomycetota bacterium]
METQRAKCYVCGADVVWWRSSEMAGWKWCDAHLVDDCRGMILPTRLMRHKHVCYHADVRAHWRKLRREGRYEEAPPRVYVNRLVWGANEEHQKRRNAGTYDVYETAEPREPGEMDDRQELEARGT